jgi:hypothetical protein
MVIDFDGYSGDCCLHGRLDLGDGRLTDLLNSTPELRILEVRLESLADGRVVELPEVTVVRDELCAVAGSGPRGDVARRLRTRSTRVVVEVGPYHVEGVVHGTPASDPLAAALRRAAWLPITDATVTYRRGGDEVHDAMETLIVNRDLATSLRHVEETVLALPWEKARTSRPATSRALDLTGTPQDADPADDDDTPPRSQDPVL